MTLPVGGRLNLIVASLQMLLIIPDTDREESPCDIKIELRTFISDRRQLKMLSTIDEGGSKIARNSRATNGNQKLCF